jgi:hypothetical protein
VAHSHQSELAALAIMLYSTLAFFIKLTSLGAKLSVTPVFMCAFYVKNVSIVLDMVPTFRSVLTLEVVLVVLEVVVVAILLKKNVLGNGLEH